MALTKFMTGAAVAGAMAFGAGTARAVILVDNSGIPQRIGSVNTSDDFATLGADFIWIQTSVFAFVNFTVTTLTDLFFTDYLNGGNPISTANSDQSSLLILDLLNAPD